MKNMPLLVICALCFAACHRKTVPTKTTNAVVVHPTKKETLPPPSKKVAQPEIKPDTAVAAAPPVVLPSAMIVVDGYGKILTPQDKLPDQNIKPDYSQIARAFTPQEMANLKARYKMVPPKILYVPDQYAQKSYRGTYAVYKKKFWYWKKDDGLFYLDEIYYK
jgi:hypothetical protein